MTATDSAEPLQSPETAAAELLAADSAFGAAAGAANYITTLSSMFATDVIMPSPGSSFTEGRAQVIAMLQRDSLDARSRAHWTPLRAGISADGLHGFTFGYMTLLRPDSTRAYFKYLSYWLRGGDGWRVRAYKRAPRDSSQFPVTPFPTALPPRMQRASTDSALVARFTESLAETERAFSRDAQSMGLGAAFAHYGHDDAVNMGPPDRPFVAGAAAIGEMIGGGDTTRRSPVSWAPDYRVLVASSGDLGITFGFIHRNAAAAGARPFPFFTIWRRPNSTGPWRYIAE
jgi:ketosteroid isomerase-like protein